MVNDDWNIQITISLVIKFNLTKEEKVNKKQTQEAKLIALALINNCRLNNRDAQ